MLELKSTIEQIRMGYRTYPGKSRAFEIVLRDYYERLRTSQSSTRDLIEKSFPALAGALSQPELVDQALLVNYIAELIRLVENVGLGFTFGQYFIDQAINVYRQINQPLIDLYIAKADFLRLKLLEDPEREVALLEARSCVEATNDKEGLLRVVIRLAEYYTEVSLYEQALRACKEGEALILGDASGQLRRHYVRVLTHFGMNYTTLFRHNLAEQYLFRAKELLEQHLQEQEMESEFLGERTLATVLHYLGRITLSRGRLQEALTYYVRGQEHQDRCPLDVAANAFCHLRIGELLIEASSLEQASDHIRISQQLFDEIEFSSSGRLQVSLAWASIANKRGDYKGARACMLQARREAQQRNFPRGDLWCLVRLFWLDFQHFRMHRALYVFFLGMRTWQNGELGRIDAPRLLGQYILQVLLTPFKLLRRSPHTVMGAATFNAPVSTCICPIHLPKGLEVLNESQYDQ